MKLISKNKKDTAKIAAILAKEILFDREQNQKNALVISLEGDLGAGKTTFTQGFAKGLKIKETPKSPTFVIMRVYSVLKSDFNTFIHIDAYRVKSKDLLALGWRNLVKNPKNIILVEWGDRISGILPKDAFKIKFKHGKNFNERILLIK